MLERYGANDANRIKAGFAQLPSRAAAVGADVRFVQLFNGAYAMGEGVGNWDGHRQIVADYNRHGPILDQSCRLAPRSETAWVAGRDVGGLGHGIRSDADLRRARGTGPQPAWLHRLVGGAGVKKGFSYGATDDFGYRAVEDVCTIYDLHATLLHLTASTTQRLTFYHNGIERRLTDVHGHVIRPILSEGAT